MKNAMLVMVHLLARLAVHGEFVIEVRRGGDPAPLLLYMANS